MCIQLPSYAFLGTHATCERACGEFIVQETLINYATHN